MRKGHHLLPGVAGRGVTVRVHVRELLAAIALVVGVGGAGCGIQLEDSLVQLTNSCESASDCAGGTGQCAPLQTGKACVGTTALRTFNSMIQSHASRG